MEMTTETNSMNYWAPRRLNNLIEGGAPCGYFVELVPVHGGRATRPGSRPSEYAARLCKTQYKGGKEVGSTVVGFLTTGTG